MKFTCTNIASIIAIGGIVALGAGCSPDSKGSDLVAGDRAAAPGDQRLSCKDWIEHFLPIQEARLSDLLYEISQAAQAEFGADEQQTDKLIQCLDQTFLVNCNANQICHFKKR